MGFSLHSERYLLGYPIQENWEVPVVCPRCKKETTIKVMSRFNTQEICLDCEAIEKRHPLYAQARQAEFEATQSGDLNFPGIGAPPDLLDGSFHPAPPGGQDDEK